MSKVRRVLTIIASLIAIEGSIALMTIPDIAYEVLALGVGMMLVYYGVRYIIYYITNAQHMVGGKWFMLIGIIMFDMGTFAIAIFDRAQVITIVYIIITHFVVTVLGAIRTVGDRKDNNPRWKISLAQTIAGFIQITLSVIFINHSMIPLYLYCIYAIYSAILMIISAFKKTAIVYVQ